MSLMTIIDTPVEYDFDIYFAGRRSLAEHSSLIRHPSSKQKHDDILRFQQQPNNGYDLSVVGGISPENNIFVKEVI